MTPREFVADTAQKLLNQGKYASSKDGMGCWYRTEDGEDRKCAIGQHIPDEMYSPNMEGNYISSLIEQNPDLGLHFYELTGITGIEEQIDFLSWVQHTLHDVRSENKLPLLTVDEALTAYDNYFVERTRS